MRTRIRRATTALVATGVALAAGGAQGSGFALVEQSVKGLGNAFAGGAAVAEDPSTVYWNPAGLTRLDEPRFNLAAYVISPSSEFDNQGSTASPGTPLQAPLTGGDGGNGAVTNPVINVYFSTPLNERLTFGLGINTPFGLETDYPDDWVGRYHAVGSRLTTFNVNPSLGYEINDRLSVGGGVSVQYAHARLTNKIDYGTICQAAEIAGAVPAGTCAAFGVTPQGSDGGFAVRGEDIGFGANLGVLYELDESTRVGAHYRSQVQQDLEGDADFTVPPAVQGILGAAGVRSRTTPAAASIDLPDTFSVSGYKRFGDWAVMADVTWTNWSRFDELRIEFDDSTADHVQPQGWDDSFRYSVGVSYFVDSRWTLRGGAAYDETPIPSPELRTPRIPATDRTWVTLGTSYAYSDALSVDVGYAHLFVDDSEINNTDGTTGHRLTGEFENSVDIFGAQLAWRF